MTISVRFTFSTHRKAGKYLSITGMVTCVTMHVSFAPRCPNGLVKLSMTLFGYRLYYQWQSNPTEQDWDEKALDKQYPRMNCLAMLIQND